MVHDRLVKVLACVAVVGALVLGLHEISHRSYVLFHSISEFFSIAIACGIFAVAWSLRHVEGNSYLKFIGLAYLPVAGFTGLHMLAYQGMGVFPAQGANLPTQLWIITQFFQAGALLLAPLMIGRKLRPTLMLTGLLTLATLLLVMVYLGRFPDCFVEGRGLTPFKIASEYVICCMLAGAAALLFVKREHFDPYVLHLTLAAVEVTIVSELAFTLYTHPYGWANWAGHILKSAAFYLLYKAMLETLLTQPYRLLFRDLQRAKAEAEAANAAKDQFLAVLSHELRNPLNPVLMAVSALRRQADLPAKVHEDLELIHRNTELEARLIDDLLDLTRITRGKLEISRRPVDAHELLRQALQICQGNIQAKSLHLDLELKAAHAQVHADPARLQQVFWNLVKNAVKFTPEGGWVRVRTWNGERGREEWENGGMGEWEMGRGGDGERGRNGDKETRGQGDKETDSVSASSIENRKSKIENPPDSALSTQHSALFIEITDTGIGIEADALGRIFNAFEQGGQEVTQQFGGLGLGLAISKALAEAHGGRITASSPGAGQGATFRIELPGTPAALSAAVATSPAQAHAAPAAPERLVQILLVEDHEDTRRLMTRLLTALNYQVEPAGTVRSALEAARAASFDLVISDLGLPDGTGYELMQQLKAAHGLRGIALSGYGMESDIQRSIEAGFADHLTKPVDFQKLQDAIQRLAM